MSVTHLLAETTTYGWTPGRIGAGTAGLVALVGVVAGGLTVYRRKGRRGAVIAIATGVFAVALGGVVAATADGGIGTGNGLAGAFVAIVAGLLGIALGWFARSRRVDRV